MKKQTAYYLPQDIVDALRSAAEAAFRPISRHLELILRDALGVARTAAPEPATAELARRADRVTVPALPAGFAYPHPGPDLTQEQMDENGRAYVAFMRSELGGTRT